MIGFMKRIFITGGTGFFGKSIFDYWSRKPRFLNNVEITVLSRDPEAFCMKYPDISRQCGLHWVKGDIRTFQVNGKYDYIVHAATTIDLQNTNEMYSSIIDGTNNLLSFAKVCGAKKILYVSSGAVYGPRTSPASENDECLPVTAYGKGKLQAERMLLDSGLDVKIARCFAFAGRHLPRTIHYAIGNFIQDCLDGQPIVINGDGTPLRSYMYADDLVEWLFAILERGKNGRVYNVGSDKALSIRELAASVRSILGVKNEIVVKGKPDSAKLPSVYVPVIERAKYELGLELKTSIESSIRRMAGLSEREQL